MKKTSYAATLVAVLAVAFIASDIVESQRHRGQRHANFEEAKKAYDDYIKRPSFQMRTRGRVGVAETRDNRAFDLLAQNYAQPEAPREQVKHTLVTMSALNFTGNEFIDRWHVWRNRHKQAEDSWLWYRSLILHQNASGEDELLRVAAEERDPFIRAAALEALAHNGSEKAMLWWTEQLDRPRWRGTERVIMLETAARHFMTERARLGSSEYREFGLKLIPYIEDRNTPERTKLVMARFFREALGGDKLYVDATPWRERLLNPGAAAVDHDEDDSKGGGATVVRPTRFMGVEAAGKRIAYVIDLSCSMLIPLTRQEREELQGPVTGESGQDRPQRREGDDEADLIAQLPWDKINNRFDAAREYLKLSLRTLRRDQHFCVIMFGTEAEFLRATPHLVPVQPRAIQQAIQELDAIRPGPAQGPTRPHGTLMGNTNLHGGMHRAFQATTRNVIPEWSGINEHTFLNGADTIFLLSDGDPTDDDWAQVDRRDEWDRTGDPESGIRAPDQDYLRFPGPYGYNFHWTYLPDDIHRLNLFRKCEIHCVGIGEVTQNFLNEIARHGMGQVRFIGSGRRR